MGGNVFAGKTSRIHRNNIGPTLTNYFAELAMLFPAKAHIFNNNTFISLGSVGKVETSGDIDLGINASTLLDSTLSDTAIAEWGIDTMRVDAEFILLTKRARTATSKQLRMKAFLKELTIYINHTAPNLHCDEKKVTDSNIFGLYNQTDQDGNDLNIGVQIDWMIGEIQWLQFSYYSSVYSKESNVKGLHRTQLMLAAFEIANLSFNHAAGVKDRSTGIIVATTPVDALLILSDKLKFKIGQSESEDYYKLHAILKSKLNITMYNRLLSIYFKILDSTRTDIPDNLHHEWKARKLQLGLTGKFLPETSMLKDYIS